MDINSLIQRTKKVEVTEKNEWEIEGKRGITYRGEFMGGTVKFSSSEPLEVGCFVQLNFDVKFDQGGNASLKASAVQDFPVSRDPKHKGN